ncbi:chromate efflux transporter [Paenibacillus cymbidii]|uniref:chromate efflux transporter n=1 Tax=Paenibacillus cymbidii TaxID=1639034 RepID=UPI001081E56B|nr:chromate efflux transporter [Paenibacillus cymbidii]
MQADSQTQTEAPQPETGTGGTSGLEILAVSAKLGLTSFGGPIAHLGYFHNEYIRRRRWLDERTYADLVALCQFLPGPASSQVGIGIGMLRGGVRGGLLAWLGFTLPSAVLMILFAYVLQSFDIAQAGAVHGLKIVAVAIVAQAVLGMGRKLAPDRTRATIAVAVCAGSLLWHAAVGQLALLAAAGATGLLLYRRVASPALPALRVPVGRGFGAVCLALFFALLLGLPLLRSFGGPAWLALADSFYRTGALIFGGGHVMLPLLEREFVPSGLVSQADFLAGYGAAQALPGPLSTFAGYLGAMMSGWSGGLLAIAAIFLPAYLLVAGTLPFWNGLRANAGVQGALTGINAAVVGILLAALYDPLWTTAILAPADCAVAVLLFVMLEFWKLPPWTVVLAGLLCGTAAAWL